jgi:hypothetical protein
MSVCTRRCSRKIGGFRAYFLEAAAPPFDIIKTVENLGNERIAASGRNIFNIAFLNECADSHSSRRPDFDTVIEHIDVDFSADNVIISVHQGISEYLESNPLGESGLPILWSGIFFQQTFEFIIKMLEHKN